MAGFHISMVSVAIPFAAKAFVGKTDKTGREGAILHSLRVCGKCCNFVLVKNACRKAGRKS